MTWNKERLTLISACIGAALAEAERGTAPSADEQSERSKGAQDVLLRMELELELSDATFDAEDFRRRVFTWYCAHRGERPAFVPVWAQRWTQATRDLRPNGGTNQ